MSVFLKNAFLIQSLTLLWMIVFFGVGSAFVKVTKLASPNPFFSAILGIVFTGFLVILLNFFVPISPMIAYAFTALGFTLAIFFFRKLLNFYRAASKIEITLYLALFFILSITTLISSGIYDTGLYHMGTIMWIQQSQVPFGLANLADRFAFNSIWHALAAIMVLPKLHWPSIFVINFLILVLASAHLVFLALRNNQKRFSVMAFFAFLFLVTFDIPSLDNQLGGPSTDLPGAIFVILGFMLLASVYYSRFKTNYVALFLLISFFGAFVKLSYALFALTGLALILAAQLLLARRRQFLFTICLAAVLGAPYLARNVILSGCLAFPTSSTCFYSLKWSVPFERTERLTYVMRTFDKRTNEPDKFDWVIPKLVELSQTQHFSLFLVLVGLSLLMFILSRQRGGLAAAFLLLPFIPSLILWFNTQPNMRYSFGLFIAINSFLSLSLLARLHLLQATQTNLKKLVVIGLLVALSNNINFFTRNYKRVVGWPRYGYPISYGTTAKQTIDHSIINVTNVDRCFDAPLPCTEEWRADLKTKTRKGDKLPYMFYR